MDDLPATTRPPAVGESEVANLDTARDESQPQKHEPQQDDHDLEQADDAPTSESGVGARAQPTATAARSSLLSPFEARPGLNRPGHELPFVAPSSYLRPKLSCRTVPASPPPMSPIDEEQLQGLKGLRNFLRVRTSYDVLPLSFRLIVLDNDLMIKKSLNILNQNGIVSAPLWDSHRGRFAGLLTSTDFINVIQYYCQFPDEIDNVDKFRLSSLREIEKAIGVEPLETVSVLPTRPLYEACSRMLKSRARRIPLVDIDDETGRETVVSVITQYRILKFIAVNTEQYTALLRKEIRDICLGTYEDLATCRMGDSVVHVVRLMVKHNISAIPVIDKNNVVLNVFEAVDVIPCINGGAYDELESTVGEALAKRPDDFPGIYTCQGDDRMDSIFTTIRQSRVHRFIIIDNSWHLKGILSLSDILRYVLFFGEDEYFPPMPPSRVPQEKR